MADDVLPNSYTFGKVVGRIVKAIADTSEDVDDKPQARPAQGKVIFTPKETLRKVADDGTGQSVFVTSGASEANLSSSGRILDGEGRQGIWLVTGEYRVSFQLTSGDKIEPFDILVQSINDDTAPLQLAAAAPVDPGENVTIITYTLPSGGTVGQVMTKTSTGAAWATPSGGGGTGTQGPAGPAGTDGLGWTGGSYSGTTGMVTFTSDDGLGFVTGDLRGAQGIQGIQGVPGANGATWYNGAGAGAPSTGLGVVNDYYLNSSTGDYYKKTNTSVWTLQGNLTGPQGVAGPTGPQGPAGTGGSGSGSNWGSKWVNVKDYGAVGDGTTNDTAAINSAITAAGVGGTVYFPYTSQSYMVDPLKPLSYQTWQGQHTPRYNWDNTWNGGSILRARGTQTAVIYNDNTTTNGVSTLAARGVTLRNLGIFGGASGTSRTARGIDFGQMAGPERGWNVESCVFMYCTTAIAGYVWASQIRFCHFARNGYGFAPDQGLGGGRANDVMFIGNFLYFNVNHAVSLSGSVESGLVTIAFNRVERSGASVTGSATYDPTGTPENAYAAGIFISRATGISIVGNTSDANTGPGLSIQAVAHGAANNIQSTGNVWKRDGIGTNDGSAQLPGIDVKDTAYVQIRDTVTYGDPNDSGAGIVAPYYGLQYEANDYFTFDGSLQLDTNANTLARGLHQVGTANWMSSITDSRQSLMGVPATTTASAPVTANLQKGSTYFDTTLNALRSWTGSAWVSGGGGGGGVTDHGALTGLTDDDHPQYALTDGTRGPVRVLASGAAIPPGTPAGTLIVRY
jgi:hypothetical protein